MQLAEGSGEGRLASLVGSRHDQYPLGPFEPEIVRHGRRSLLGELAREDDVETAAALQFLGDAGDLGIAECRAGPPDRRNIIQVGDIELYLAVEGDDARVGVGRVPGAEPAQLLELAGVEPCHDVEDVGLDIVQIARIGELREIFLVGALREPLEYPLDLDAVLGLAFVFLHANRIVPEEEAIPHRGEGFPQGAGLPRARRSATIPRSPSGNPCIRSFPASEARPSPGRGRARRRSRSRSPPRRGTSCPSGARPEAWTPGPRARALDASRPRIP